MSLYPNLNSTIINNKRHYNIDKIHNNKINKSNYSNSIKVIYKKIIKNISDSN